MIDDDSIVYLCLYDSKSKSAQSIDVKEEDWFINEGYVSSTVKRLADSVSLSKKRGTSQAA